MPRAHPPHASTPAAHGYCPRCGERLGTPALSRGGESPVVASSSSRPSCPACGYIRFDDPRLAAGVVAERAGAILLVRRNHEPAYGQWSFPAGFVDRGETVEAAAVRETREEAGLAVRIDALLGVYSSSDNPVVFVAYAATAPAGEPVAGDEAMEVAFFPLDSLPDLAFDHDGAIVADWRRHRDRREQ